MRLENTSTGPKLGQGSCPASTSGGKGKRVCDSLNDLVIQHQNKKVEKDKKKADAAAAAAQERRLQQAAKNRRYEISQEDWLGPHPQMLMPYDLRDLARARSGTWRLGRQVTLDEGVTSGRAKRLLLSKILPGKK